MPRMPGGYDAWRLAGPDDDAHEPCKCGEDDCTCAEDAMWDRADYEHDKARDLRGE